MGHSSLLGIHDDDGQGTPGRDAKSLGPSDTSDSGSDVAGIEDPDDPNLPADVALEGDRSRPETSSEALAPGLGTDSTGTGERRSAGGDAGREAADISVDRIEDPDGDADSDDLRLAGGIDDLARVADTSVDSDAEEADDEDEEADGGATAPPSPAAPAPGPVRRRTRR